jgi:hypothetical protein
MPPVKDCDAGHCSLQLSYSVLCIAEMLKAECESDERCDERERGEGEMVPVPLWEVLRIAVQNRVLSS